MAWFRLGRSEDLPPGAGVRVDVDGRAVALFNVDGELRAIDDDCLHMGGHLSDGTVSGEIVTCPLHQWRYDLRSGARVDRRGSSLPVHRVTRSQGWIVMEEPV